MSYFFTFEKHITKHLTQVVIASRKMRFGLQRTSETSAVSRRYVTKTKYTLPRAILTPSVSRHTLRSSKRNLLRSCSSGTSNTASSEACSRKTPGRTWTHTSQSTLIRIYRGYKIWPTDDTTRRLGRYLQMQMLHMTYQQNM